MNVRTASIFSSREPRRRRIDMCELTKEAYEADTHRLKPTSMKSVRARGPSKALKRSLPICARRRNVKSTGAHGPSWMAGRRTARNGQLMPLNTQWEIGDGNRNQTSHHGRDDHAAG